MDASLCDLDSPQAIVSLNARHLAVDASGIDLSAPITFSPSEPTGADIGDLWVKEEGGGVGNPRGIGIRVNGEYVIIPIPADQTPPEPAIPSGAIIYYPEGPVPSGWVAVTSSGLPEITGNYQYIRKST